MSLCPKTCLFAHCSSSNACIMVLPKLTFVLLCSPFLLPLPHRWWFVVGALWLRFETRVSTVLVGVLLTLFCTWNVTRSVRSSWKWSIVVHHNQVTHPLFQLITWVCLNDQTFHIFHNGWIDHRDTFHAFVRLWSCVMGWKSVNMKHIG